jgi:DNA-binding response OmpR family regulator
MPSRVLVVDDEPSVCDLIQNILSTVGMEVLALTRSAEVATYIRNEKFAIVLVDLRMPAPDGIEITRQIRASSLNQRTPLVMLSDDPKAGAISEGFGAGANFFLYKPVDRARLLKLIRATQGAVEHERRRFRRVALRMKVRLGFENREIEGETIDVSLNGMLVKAPTTLPAGSPVKVSLFLSPGTKPIVGSGAVARKLNENQMGIYLNQLTAADSERLQEFLLPLILRGGREVNVVRA